MLPTTIINNYLQLLTTKQENMIFIKKMTFILRGSAYYKQSILLVNSSALHIFIENVVKSIYKLYSSDEE